MLVCGYSAERDQILQMMTSGVEVGWTEESRWNVNQLVYYPVYHHQLCVDSALLKCGPSKVVDQLAGTTSGSVVAFNKIETICSRSLFTSKTKRPGGA